MGCMGLCQFYAHLKIPKWMSMAFLYSCLLRPVPLNPQNDLELWKSTPGMNISKSSSLPTLLNQKFFYFKTPLIEVHPSSTELSIFKTYTIID